MAHMIEVWPHSPGRSRGILRREISALMHPKTHHILALKPLSVYACHLISSEMILVALVIALLQCRQGHRGHSKSSLQAYRWIYKRRKDLHAFDLQGTASKPNLNGKDM